jgi:hypothetical protein
MLLFRRVQPGFDYNDTRLDLEKRNFYTHLLQKHKLQEQGMSWTYLSFFLFTLRKRRQSNTSVISMRIYLGK